MKYAFALLFLVIPTLAWSSGDINTNYKCMIMGTDVKDDVQMVEVPPNFSHPFVLLTTDNGKRSVEIALQVLQSGDVELSADHATTKSKTVIRSVVAHANSNTPISLTEHSYEKDLVKTPGQIWELSVSCSNSK